MKNSSVNYSHIRIVFICVLLLFLLQITAFISPVYARDYTGWLQLILSAIAALMFITGRRPPEQPAEYSISREILNNINGSIFSYNPRSQEITYANPGSAGVYGFSSKEIMEMGFTGFKERLHPDDEAAYLDYINKISNPAQNDDSESSQDYRWMHKNGSYHWYNGTHCRILDTDALVKTLVFNVRDVSHLKSKMQQLQIDKDRLNLALTVTNDGMYDWDVPTNNIFFDSRYYTLAGYEPNEFPGTLEEWVKRVHPEDYEKTSVSVKAYLSGDIPVYDEEFRFKCKDGTWMWIRARVKVINRSPEGEPLRIVGTHTDINERKKAEERIRQLQNYLSNIIDSMPSALIGVDTNCMVTQWNKAAEKSTGLPAAKALNRHVTSVYPEIETKTESILDSIRTGKANRHRKKFMNSSSGQDFVDITIYPLKSNGTEGAVIRIDDVSDRVRMEETMIQTEKMLSVGGLAAGMAHEINNPLSGMIQTAENLNNRLMDAQLPANLRAGEESGLSMEVLHNYLEKRNIKRMLDSLRESGTRVSEIVDNMLSFARRSDSSLSIYNMEDLLNKTLELASTDYDLKKNYDFKSILIKKDFGKDLPLIPCDAGKIQQVLLNILSNGAQAMTEQHIEASAQNEEIAPPCFYLRLYCKQDTEMLFIEIEDNGPGMNEETRKRALEPFFTTKPIGIGTGLGLSVSYFIITENHRGTLQIESEPGRGTTFIIQLPLSGKSNDGNSPEHESATNSKEIQ